MATKGRLWMSESQVGDRIRHRIRVLLQWVDSTTRSLLPLLGGSQRLLLRELAVCAGLTCGRKAPRKECQKHGKLQHRLSASSVSRVESRPDRQFARFPRADKAY